MRELTLPCERIREADRLAVERFAMPSVLLMENAARNAANMLVSFGLPPRTIVCCGRGANGGDGFCMARHLQRMGSEVTILLAAEESSIQGDAAINLAIAKAAGILIVDGRFDSELSRLDRLSNSDWIVDALLGTGARGSPRPPYDELIRRMNASPARRLAVDVPSGLDADLGVLGEPTVRADVTVTFFARKLGFDREQARAVLGQFFVVDIGEPAALRSLFESDG
ncbi:MAG TPA: NAD(P)H-hydrate epimerase [Pirellulaceae bacterium]|jgi:NAD(P)H-hydrate epimerase|nr:NAD(P)H-hydrate epimerase [Pirellulaceae bacterium]